MHFDALVLSGGGINGLAHVGCLAGLGIDDVLAGVDTVVGTSAGSLVAAIFCLGLDMREVFRTLYAMDRRRLGSTANALETVVASFGLDDGRGLETLIRTFVPPALTFADLLRDRGKTLLITATRLNDGAPVVFGPKTPHADVPIALAVRMSCSIPLVFAAVRYRGALYVDGSVLDNFPIGVAAAQKKKRVLGIAVSRFHEKPETAATIETLGDFAGALMRTVVAAAQKQPPPRRGGVSTIDIRSEIPTATLFDVTDAQIAYLYNLGYVKGREFRRKVA